MQVSGKFSEIFNCRHAMCKEKSREALDSASDKASYFFIGNLLERKNAGLKPALFFPAKDFYLTTAIFSFLLPLNVYRVRVPSLMSPLASKAIGPVTPS
jgi:hypothetical protein